MKTKIIILSSNDIYFTIPIHNLILKDERIDIQKIYILKEKNHFKKKIKILILLNLFDLIKIISKKISSFFAKKNFSKYEYFSNGKKHASVYPGVQ